MNLSRLPKTIIYKSEKYCLYIQYGQHGEEWEAGYQIYYQYSEPEKIKEVYDKDLKTCIKKLNEKLIKNGFTKPT